MTCISQKISDQGPSCMIFGFDSTVLEEKITRNTMVVIPDREMHSRHVIL